MFMVHVRSTKEEKVYFGEDPMKITKQIVEDGFTQEDIKGTWGIVPLGPYEPLPKSIGGTREQPKEKD